MSAEKMRETGTNNHFAALSLFVSDSLIRSPLSCSSPRPCKEAGERRASSQVTRTSSAVHPEASSSISGVCCTAVLMWLNTPPVFFFRQRQARHDKRQKAEAARAYHGVPKLPGVTELSVCDPPQRVAYDRHVASAQPLHTVERKLRPCRRSVNCPRTQQERLHKNGEGPIKNGDEHL